MNNLARADGTAIRVLVVDDEPTLAEVLASVLRYEGWEARTAADGTSAVRAARDFEPDAVILDVMLPDVDGLKVLLRTREPVSCPASVTTGSSPSGDQRRQGWPDPATAGCSTCQPILSS